MRMSISTTSGSQLGARARRPRAPSPASPTTSMSGCALEDHAEPAPHQRLVVGDEDADHVTRRPSGSRAWTAKPPPRARAAAQLAAVERDPLPHPDKPVAARRRSPTGRPPSFSTRTSRRRGRSGPGRDGARVPRVLEHVRQRLLHDAVRGELNARGKAGRTAPRSRARVGHARIAHLLRRGRSRSAEAALRALQGRALGVLAEAPRASCRISAECLPAGLLDRKKRCLAGTRRESVGSNMRAAPAWTVITPIACPTTSWRSRPIYARSAATAAWRRSSRSRRPRRGAASRTDARRSRSAGATPRRRRTAPPEITEMNTASRKARTAPGWSPRSTTPSATPSPPTASASAGSPGSFRNRERQNHRRQLHHRLGRPRARASASSASDTITDEGSGGGVAVPAEERQRPAEPERGRAPRRFPSA